MAVTIDYTHEGRVADLRIDFDERNLFTPAATDELRDAVEGIDGDAVILTIAADGSAVDPGNARGLSAGMDVTRARDFSPAEGRAMLDSLYRTFQTVRSFAGVTVCGCGAYALGAGFELALSCDFRVATREAVLGLPEVNVGIPTLIQGGLLVRLVGLQTAKELCYLGETVSGETAVEMGLVNHAVPAARHDEHMAGLVAELAEKSPAILRLQHEVFTGWRSPGIERGMEHSLDVAERAFDTHDLHEAMDAFVENREPSFEGW